MRAGHLKALYEGLSHNKGLDTLALSENHVDEVCGGIIAKALERNRFLRHLDLAKNCLKDAGGLAFARMLKTNAVLESLNLVDNSLKDASGQAFSEVLRHNCTIQKILLDLNPINMRYLIDIAKCLKVNKTHCHKKITPVLAARLQRLVVDEGTKKRLTHLFSQKKKEHSEALDRYRKQKKRLHAVKAEEFSKREELTTELKTLTSRRQDLTRSLEDCEQAITSTTTQFHSSVRGLEDKIGYLVYDIKKAEKRSKL